jgi:16S rRNA (guanine527-N7)-methyltransferase
MSEFRELLIQGLKSVGFGPALSEAQLAALDAHYELLVRWNAKINLTSIRSLKEAVERHYCECLFFGSLLQAQEGEAILDAGSGAGFPGIPIAILRPGLRITLLESDHRKAVFLREAVRKLTNVSVLSDRLERIAGTWNWIVSRAVNPVEIVGEALRLGRGVGLLLSDESIGNLSQFPRIQWSPPIRMPWGEHRVALFGSSAAGIADCS